MYVKPKKSLGQHFLTDDSIAQNIAELLSGHSTQNAEPYKHVLEIGPGTGVLTRFLLPNPNYETHAVELDRESVAYLKKAYPALTPRLIEGDFLEMKPADYLPNLPESEPFAIIGNFPYNISSQIFFNVLDYRDRITEIVCMLQREVAQRLASPPGKKHYGILSVFLQAWYDVKYEFTVPPEVFDPPPKVHSGVISVRRNNVTELGCNERRFIQVVKHGFNQRRKTLRNALKSLGITEAATNSRFMDQRAEQLSVADFVELTNMMTTEG